MAELSQLLYSSKNLISSYKIKKHNCELESKDSHTVSK